MTTTILFFACLISLMFTIPTLIHMGVHKMDSLWEMASPLLTCILCAWLFYLLH